MDQNLKELMEDVAKERLKVAKTLGPGTEEGDAAFKEGLQAFNAYNELVKTEDAHEEQAERRAMEKDKQARDEAIRKKERMKDWIIFGVTTLGTIAVPILGHILKKDLVKYVCKAEEFESFTSTPGKAIGKMFDFGK